MGKGKNRRYPEKKTRDLSEDEKRRIRALIEEHKGNTEGIAEDLKCSTSQVAGIKAAMNRN